MRCVLNRTGILVASAHANEILACIARHAVFGSDAGVDGDVGGDDRTDLAVQEFVFVFQPVGMDTCWHRVCPGNLCLYARRQRLQFQATRGCSSTLSAKQYATTDNVGNSPTRAASDLSSPPSRDAGMEHWEWDGRMLRPHSVCSGYGRGHDSCGRCGVGEAIWRGVLRLPRDRSGSPAKAALKPMCTSSPYNRALN